MAISLSEFASKEKHPIDIIKSNLLNEQARKRDQLPNYLKIHVVETEHCGRINANTKILNPEGDLEL